MKISYLLAMSIMFCVSCNKSSYADISESTEYKPKYFFVDLKGNIFYGRINPLEDNNPNKISISSVQQLISERGWDKTSRDILIIYEAKPIKNIDTPLQFHQNVDCLKALLTKNRLHFSSQIKLDEKSMDLLRDNPRAKVKIPPKNIYPNALWPDGTRVWK